MHKGYLEYNKKKIKKRNLINLKWTDRDLNPGPPPCQGDDLPSELPAQKNHFHLNISNFIYK